MRWGTATIEALAVRARRIGAALTIAWLAVLPGTGGLAQAQSADDLVDRIRQIQAEQQAAPQAFAPPALGEDEIRAIVAESLGVEILGVEVVEHDGAPAYAITVMNPPGNRNDAFQVATLLFDGATGALLGQQPTAPRAAVPAAATAPPPHGFEGSGPEIRRRTWR